MTARKSLSIKGIAIILMIIHHLFTWGQAEYISIASIFFPNNLTIEEFCGAFGKLCVTLYLFLSGYGFSSKYIGQSDYVMKYTESFAIAWRVYRKYLLVLLIFLPYGFLKGVYQLDAKSIVGNITAFDTTYNKECWFLFVYILLVIFVLPLLIDIQDKIDDKWIAVGSLFLIICGYAMRFMIVHSPMVWFRDTKVFFNIYYFMLSQFSFVVGWLCRRRDFFEKFENFNVKFPLWIFLMAILMVVKVYCPGGMLIDTILTPIFIDLCLKALKYHAKAEKLFVLLGKYSTYIWMTHTFFAFYYWSNLIYGFKYSLLIVCVLTVISLTTSYALVKVELFIRKMERVLNSKETRCNKGGC